MGHVLKACTTVTLSAATSLNVTVQALTADGTAVAGSDYTSTGPTTLTFAPGGALTQTLTVPVLGPLLVAGPTGFSPRDYFQLDDEGQRAAPQVKL